MEEPGFWDIPEKAQEQMKELGSLKEDRDTYRQLITAKEDMETLIEMGYEENDPSVVPDSILCRLIDVLILTPPVQLTRRYSLFSYKPHSPLQSPHCRTRRNYDPEVPSEHRRLPDTWA